MKEIKQNENFLGKKKGKHRAITVGTFLQKQVVGEVVTDVAHFC